MHLPQIGGGELECGDYAVYPKFTIPLLSANEVWGKVMFLHLCVILFTGEGVSLTETPRGQRPPYGKEQIPQKLVMVSLVQKIKFPQNIYNTSFQTNEISKYFIKFFCASPILITNSTPEMYFILLRKI